MRKSTCRAGLVAALATTTLLVAAAPASAGDTTFWPSVYQSACSSGDMSGLGAGSVARRNNFGYNRDVTRVYANGGYWSVGSYYTSGSYQNSAVRGVGLFTAVHNNSYYSTMQLDPFIRNDNGVTVGSSGCFHWIG